MNNNKDIYNKYIEGLKIKYLSVDSEQKKEYQTFITNKKGITDEEMKDLLKEYPDIPTTLLELLKYSNGTDIHFFQSDVDDGKYPYYLISSSEMIKTKNIVQEHYSDFITREFDDEVDDKITDDINNIKWLLFSNCTNGGATSQLFIDFTPSEKGKKGQVVRYLHDPNSMIVIADSFDQFLSQIINSNYTFIENKEETSKLSKKQNIKSIITLIILLLLGIILIISGIKDIFASNIFSGIGGIFVGLIFISPIIFIYIEDKRQKH